MLLAINATAHTCNENSTFPLSRVHLSLCSWLCSESVLNFAERNQVFTSLLLSFISDFAPYGTTLCFALRKIRKKKTYFAISRWKINRKKGKEILYFARLNITVHV